MEHVRYDFGFMFAYSERPGTLAARKMEDDVPEEVKGRRLQEIIDLQMECSRRRTERMVGHDYRVLVEGTSKKSAEMLYGRNSQNVVVVFSIFNLKPGDYAVVHTSECTATTLIGTVVSQ